ncbi:amidohydrolase/deacetylase family metallohydrolase [Sodalis sp. C49]|uniref:amidohydrolase/deacetylase family metallohydrolase n=1 Tax=unclassified Sodalis (in: enterobacteria) TaxID=2636512 RepID=UPI003965AC65
MAPLYDLIIRQARQPDGTLADIAVLDGRIAAVGAVPTSARREINLGGRYYASAGWIDSHVHCYPASPIYHDEPDKVGIACGVTTVVDAGSTGADAVDDFYQLTRAAKTRVYALLNIARTGIVTQDELADMTRIDKALAGEAIARHRGFIIGIKARISSSVVGANGVKPLQRAKEIQRENGNLPLMVHIGNNPPDLGRIVDLLGAGDIVTHCYNGKPNRILTPAGELRASVRKALQRGVRLDVGHGTASFSFEVARLAIAQGIYPYTISSDIYCRNRIDGPVHSLAAVMAKFFTLGMTLAQVIDCVTLHAADALRLTKKGRLVPGCDADITLFDVRTAPCVFTDAEGHSVTGEQQLIPLAAVVAGVCLLTDEGKTSHVFDL